MIDLSPDQLKLVRTIVEEHFPECEVRAFGSRANGTAKKHSDLDLALVGDALLARDRVYRLQDAFEESVLPFRVDVVDWHSISEEFRRVIEDGYEVLGCYGKG